MTGLTNRLQLPLLHAGQAQKELSHNEALVLIDLVAPASVTAIADTPPADPEPGDCVIVGPAPTGAFAGRAHAIAGWTGSGWRFVAPVPGQRCWTAALTREARYEPGEWRIGELHAAQVIIDGDPVLGPRGAAVPAPTGGATVDAEARATLAAIIARMVAHGLVDAA